MTPAEPTEAQRQRQQALDKVKVATTRRELAAALVDCARNSIFADATDDIERALASEAAGMREEAAKKWREINIEVTEIEGGSYAGKYKSRVTDGSAPSDYSDTELLVLLHGKFARVAYYFHDAFGHWFSDPNDPWAKEYTGAVTHWNLIERPEVSPLSVSGASPLSEDEITERDQRSLPAAPEKKEPE